MNFALITEGISEYKIIKHIVSKYFKSQEPNFNQIQPRLINDKQENIGGWVEVLKYCERPDLEDIFVENDYIIIQIDTEQSQTEPFGISHFYPNNEMKSEEELYLDVIQKLKSLILPEILLRFEDKIFFAICIHTIECWLLPVFPNHSHQNKTLNCLEHLNRILIKKDITPISYKEKNNPNSSRAYETILKNWKKPQEIEDSAQHQFSFKKLIENLKKISEK
jgi:hypothetical protein